MENGFAPVVSGGKWELATFKRFLDGFYILLVLFLFSFRKLCFLLKISDLSANIVFSIENKSKTLTNLQRNSNSKRSMIKLTHLNPYVKRKKKKRTLDEGAEAPRGGRD